MTDLEAAKRIAELTAQRGGRAYFVGGFVRDELMGCKDDLRSEEHTSELQSPQ